MQVWPLLENLPHINTRAASSMLAVSSMIVGDLPPSSSVTLVRFLAAALITTLPTAGEPVKKMWSKGRVSRVVETEASPSKIATSSSENTSRTTLTSQAEKLGVISEGLMIDVLPAPMAYISGPKVRFTG